MTAKRRRHPVRAVAIVVAVLAALELAGRLAGMPALPHDTTFVEAPEWSYPDQIARDHDLFWRYRPDQVIRGDFFVPGAYTINSQGFRTTEYSEMKPADVMRVVCLGDDNVFGTGVADGAPWPRVLERELNARDPEKRRWEVLNLGVTNYSAYQGAILAERELPRLHPDYVLFEFSWADHQPAGYGIPDHQLRLSATWRLQTGDFLDRLAIVRWGYRLWETIAPEPVDSLPDYPVWRVPSTEYTSNIERICRAATQAGARPVLVTSPIAWPPPGYTDTTGVFHYHHRYRRLGRFSAIAAGAQFVELANAFDQHPEFYDDRRRDFRHFNARGHAFAGEFLARHLLGLPNDGATTDR
ncbi:MAG: SGNH/GDSL hydrolase family protein [Candidatus Zixiibacteriota bacterium]